MYTHTIRVPKVFWDDHRDRDCVQGAVEVTELSRHYKITMGDDDLCELWSDAFHYATNEWDFDAQGLVSSARATCNAIIKQIGLEVVAAKWLQLGLPAYCGRSSGLPIAREVQ